MGLLVGALIAICFGLWQFPATGTTTTSALATIPVGDPAVDSLAAPAQSALDQVLGVGHSVVTATATYGAASSRRTTTYDPRHVAVLDQSQVTTPGYRSSVTDNGVSSAVTDSTSTGTLQRITVAVVVDSRLRPAPKLAAIRQTVTAALALQSGRGDKITVARAAIPGAAVPGAGFSGASISGPVSIGAYLPSAFGAGLALVLLLILALETAHGRAAAKRRRLVRPAAEG